MERIVIMIGVLFLSSCHQRNIRPDTLTSGIAQVAVDESFAPIVEAEINVFESLNTEATVIPVYTSEQNVYNLLMEDSIRLIIGTRLLTDQEQAILKERKQRIRSQKIAIDGIALITHKENTDTLLTINDIRNIMSGEIGSWKQINPTSPLDTLTIIFDTPNSSMVRYIQDSLCNKLPFGKNVKALSSDSSSVDITRVNSHGKVIEYVASHPNALGFVGLNWIANPVDTTNLSFIDNVNIVSVSNSTQATPYNSYKPYPYQLALELAHRESPLEFPTGGYPLVRDIYIIITDATGGLPSGFFNFIAGDRGQRIILKSGILPANRPIRLIHITED
ncbi:substrate-binding domain-containing protein [uncultured Proteiniphilum sp.]|uniref:PstS family phosphate ABC transporter substrate-binding protein n=1 Tax=uncultured Proteiniphilum sp. TaxID=497637 RepID=UPI002605B0F7|nr:substrate-binding domain-containing protein [uncultured Proteiniphilum sp.]